MNEKKGIARLFELSGERHGRQQQAEGWHV